MLGTALLIAGCSIFAGLGVIHAVYTFTTNKFDARDAGLNEAMKRISPVPTKEISMWKAWVGFNASHSLGGYRVRRRLHRGCPRERRIFEVVGRIEYTAGRGAAHFHRAGIQVLVFGAAQRNPRRDTADRAVAGDALDLLINKL